MSLNEYREEVRREFVELMPRLSKQEIDAYFNDDDTQDTIKRDYAAFNGANKYHQSPGATAYCLFMLY